MLLQASVAKISVNNPPQQPKPGDCYVVGTSPVGTWNNQANNLAFYTTGWNFIMPWEGLTVWANDTDALFTYNGNAWVQTFNAIAKGSAKPFGDSDFGLTSSGNTQNTAIAITKQTNEFITVEAGTGAILPSSAPGDFIFVANAGANTLSVYPAFGHSINSLAPNAPFLLRPNKNCLFWAVTNNKWYANLSA